MNILVLQKNTGKAGAQNSLRRLLSSQAFSKQNIVVVTGTQGWFLEQVKLLNLSYIAIDYPAVRSLYGRVMGNRIWIKKVVDELNKMAFTPDILQCNNHFEAPFLLGLKKHFSQARTVVFIRDPDVSETDYIKYKSGLCDLRIAVSQFMQDALIWDRQSVVFNNGVFENEIYRVVDPPKPFPGRWLILGNPSKRKGWIDFFDALKHISETHWLDNVHEIVFTGVPEHNEFVEYQGFIDQLKTRIKIEFVPFYANLGEACQQFDLIVHPSRSESFGMALLEACCTGKCVISSKTGVAEKLILNKNLLFEPGNAEELFFCLVYVISNWETLPADYNSLLAIVRENFSTENNAARVIQLYESF